MPEIPPVTPVQVPVQVPIPVKPVPTVQVQLNDTQLGLVTAAMNREHVARSIRSQSQAGNRFALAQPGDAPTPSAAKFTALENTWTPTLSTIMTNRAPIVPVGGTVTLAPPVLKGVAAPAAATKQPPAQQLPTQLGPFNWNPITFSGCDVHGWAQLTLFSNGGYNFTGSFNDPDAWDYDDSLAWAVWSHSGVVYTFSHTGNMHGWGLRWLEGGSDTDSWDNAGSNAAIAGGWADLCAGWSWHAVAGVNFDIGSLVSDLEKIVGAATTIAKIIAIVA